MQINPSIFREYDIRGIAGTDLNEAIMEQIGRAYPVYLKKKRRGEKWLNTVVVGRDGRLTGKAYAAALIDGIVASGVNVIDIGEVPTGVLYYALYTLDVDGGIMLTASHNPGNYNGLKVGVGHKTIYGEEIQNFRGYVERGEHFTAKGPVTITRLDIRPKYAKKIQSIIKLDRKLKIVVDAGNGVGGVTAVPLYEALGCEVIPLFCEVDGNFPNHHPDPTVEKNLLHLRKAVLKHGADLGIGFDGDVDRLGGVDNEGTMLPGDRLLALFARQILQEKPGATIIGEVKCSRAMYEDVAKHGGKTLMWRTGHSHLKAAMIDKKAQLAGEMSGHIFFKHRWYGFDDAIYAGARLLEIVAASKQPLSKHLASIPSYHATPEITIPSTDTTKFDIVKKATDYFQKDLGLNVNTIDGARIEFEDGWGLLRASNTSPNLVMRCEATTPKRMNEIKKLIEKKVLELNG